MKKSYEEIIKELKENISKIEKPDITLDESLKLYEISTKLIKSAEKILKEVQGKIEIINQEDDE